ncbi:hypothetical protein FSP39_004301 [Pinctada imbricata]|uniref:Fibronectin type-III domain-containing protein n=1 Tax=Pinctada imbricata TaxID=66713 RepID=A0AA88XPZ7_PINIB|nr:hypothetical protein FSP39_004301 [Pinctada imbricata]
MAIIACLLPVLTLLSVSVSAENCFVPLRGGRSVPVKDVLCVVSSWENMTCTWDLQKLYNESSNNSLITDLRTRHRNFSSDEFNITLEWTVLIVNGVTKTVEANASSTELSVDGSVSTTILLTQASLKGYPRVPDSRVIIPPISKRLREPSDLVVEAYNASCVRIKWRSDKQDVRNSSFVVVRCKKDFHGKCSEFIKFKILPSSVNESYMNFFGIDVMEQKFGIAMETHMKGESHVTSGIAWSECTYQHNAVSMIPLRLGIVMKDVGSDSMTLTWRPYRCEESKGYLLQYRLDYCRMGDNCSGSTNYTLTNLLPGKYQSWIRGTFPGGVGPYSEAVQFVIHGKVSQDEAEWIVVVLVSVMTVFLVTVLYCICHTRRGIKKEIPIEIPHVKSSSEVLLQRQRKVSVDSGNSSVDSSYGSDKFLLKQSASGPEYYSKEENDSLLSESIEQGDTSSDKSIYISDEDYVTDQSNEDYDVPSYVKNDVDSGSPHSFKCLSYIQSGYTPQDNYFTELKDKEMNQMNIPKADNCDLHYEKEANKVKSDYVDKAVVDMETNKIREDYSCSTEENDEYTKVQLNQYLEYPGNVDNTGALVQKLPSNIQTGCYIYTEGYVM